LQALHHRFGGAAPFVVLRGIDPLDEVAELLPLPSWTAGGERGRGGCDALPWGETLYERMVTNG
jgi:hypothetical protein